MMTGQLQLSFKIIPDQPKQTIINDLIIGIMVLYTHEGNS